MFQLHALLIDTLYKVRLSFNEIVAGRQRGGNYLIKDALFDILSLADQLYRAKSTIPDGSGPGKIYFSENQMFDLLKEGKRTLHYAVDLYNDIITKNKVLNPVSEVNREDVQIPELVGQNKSVNELFNQARDKATVMSDLSELYL